MSGPAPREEQAHAPSTSSKFLVGKVTLGIYADRKQ